MSNQPHAYVRQWRQLRNMTQQQLADAAGVSRANIAAWEKRGLPGKLESIAEALGIPWPELGQCPQENDDD